MSTIPEHMLKKRQDISQKYLLGQGIEIGALHYPLWISDQATVRYVDRLPVEELRQQYPELQAFALVNVDIVDNGEYLRKVADDSLDFLIGNHLLEHCENPLGTIRNHLCKVKDNGILYYAIPDKTQSFDRGRPLTDFAHLVKDDALGPGWSRRSHFLEWVELVNRQTDPEKIKHDVQILEDMNYSIHFHVWDQSAFTDFLTQAQSYLGNTFAIDCIESNDTEVITILRKRPHRLKNNMSR